jgi:hypothetical protein
MACWGADHPLTGRRNVSTVVHIRCYSREMAFVTRRMMLGALAATLIAAAPPQSGEQRGSLPHSWSLLEIDERIRRREISPVEATAAQLKRIESLDSRLNAYYRI